MTDLQWVSLSLIVITISLLWRIWRLEKVIQHLYQTIPSAMPPRKAGR